jgi:cytochrome c biogenesis protein CcdA
MKKTLSLIVSFFLILLLLSTIAIAENKNNNSRIIHVEYFYDPLCTKCEKVTPIVEEVVAAYQDRVYYDKYNVKTDEGLAKGRDYGIFGVPTVILDERIFLSYKDYKGNTTLFEELLRENLEQLLKPKPALRIEKKIDKGRVEAGDTINITVTVINAGSARSKVTAEEVFNENVSLLEGTTGWRGTLEAGETINYSYIVKVNRLSYGTYPLPKTLLHFEGGEIVSEDAFFNVKPLLSIPSILAVGIFAGFNPCLFAILAFIASIALASTGKRRNVVYIVVMFSLGIFTTYLVFGLGLMQVVTPSTQDAIRGFLVLLLVLLGIWQVYDAYHLRKSEESTFRTPKAFINITKQAAEKTNLPASFFLGSLFSLIKAPCVGAIYLVILDMVKSGDATGMLYLAVYNLGVILPVLIIGVAIALGLSPERVESFRKNKRVALRLITGITLLSLALLMHLKII